MMTCLGCLGCLALLTLAARVTGQTLELNPFNKSLARSTCDNPNLILEGERIVLTAVLNITGANSSDWPLDQLILLDTVRNVNICHVNIDRDGCHGRRPDLCGYCDRNQGEEYYLVFNVTAVINQTYYWELICRWLGSSASIDSRGVALYITGQPYFTTTVDYRSVYLVQDIRKDPFLVTSDVPLVRATIENVINFGSGTWSYRTSQFNETSLSFSYWDLNVTQWDQHIDDVIDIDYQDTCMNNWTLTIPVTDRPVFDCDLPVLTRSNSTGAQVIVSCRLPPFVMLKQANCFASWDSSQAAVVSDGDRWACIVNITDYSNLVYVAGSMQVYMTYLLDTQFANGTQQLPRVVRFSVNGQRSVIAEPGTYIHLECKVYGNPNATAVLVGRGLGRIQENRSDTDQLQLTLTAVQCQDAGRYTCKGVSRFGATPSERQAHVDVIVNCPTAIKPRMPDRILNFDDGTDVLITLEVYGYPAPTQFGLRLGQGASSVEVSPDMYTTGYVELDPTRGLVTFLMSSPTTEGPQVYLLTLSNGYNRSVDLQFQVSGVQTMKESQSPWLYAFIAVICVVAAAIIIIIIVFVVKKNRKKKHDDTRFDNITAEKTSRARDNITAEKTSRARDVQPSPQERPYQLQTRAEKPQVPPAVPSPLRTTPDKKASSPAETEDIYENCPADNVYEFTE